MWARRGLLAVAPRSPAQAKPSKGRGSGCGTSSADMLVVVVLLAVTLVVTMSAAGQYWWASLELPNVLRTVAMLEDAFLLSYVLFEGPLALFH